MDTNTYLIIFVAIPLLLAQGAWIFYDARKRGEKYYWLWGIFGLMSCPGSLVVYLLTTRAIKKGGKPHE